jgi:hypothetical protein
MQRPLRDIMNRRVRPGRPRKGKEFSVTIGPVWQYADIRSDFIEYFEDLESYCVGLEYNHKNGNCHMQAYLKFRNKLRCVNVRGVVECFFPEGTINVQGCHSARNWLKYITKEDDEPYYNVKVSSLSFRAQACDWVKNSVNFEYSHPFVVSNSHKYRYMQQLYQELKAKFVTKEVLYRRMEVGWPGWYMSVCFWWNERVKYGVGGRTLYLWGNAGVGKSCCVEKICRMHDVYQPVPVNFFFGDYKSSEIVLFEEFRWERFKYNYPQLKRLLEGK